MNALSNKNIIDCFFSMAETFGDKPAIVDGLSTTSYQELAVSVKKIAFALKPCIDNSSTVPENRIVAVLTDHGKNQVESIAGAVASGCAYQPLDLNIPGPRCAMQLKTSRPLALITTKDYFGLASNLVPEQTPIVLLEDCARVELESDSLPALTPDTPAYYLSTSGTTGNPKGVLHNHTSLYRSAKNYSADMELTFEDHVAFSQPASFTPAVFSIFAPLCIGATIYTLDPNQNSISDLALWVERNSISCLNCSTTVFRRLIGQTEPKADLSSVNYMYVGGEPMFSSDVEAYQRDFADQFHLYNAMGATEIGCFSRYLVSKDKPIEGVVVPIGRPYDDVEGRIVDEEGKPVAWGEEGELVIVGDYLPVGYYSNPSLSARKFNTLKGESTNNYATGDLARLDKNGVIVHLGRKDSQVKIRGQRVELAEVEETIFKSRLVSEVLVLLVDLPEKHDEPFLAAFICPAQDEKKLRQYLRQHLPSYMVPSKIVGFDTMPTNSSGKVDRAALSNYDFPVDTIVSGNAKPSDIIELRILECYERVLELKGLDVDSDFFNFGGDSILATTLMAELQKHLLVPVPISLIVSASTPRELAVLTRKLLKGDSSNYLVKFRSAETDDSKKENAAPIICLPGMNGDALTFRALSFEMLKYRDVYAMEYPGYDGGEINYSDVEGLAKICVDEIAIVYPNGPINLVAYSAGGAVSIEVIHQLRQRGREVDALVMIDCFTPRMISFLHRIHIIENGLKKFKQLLGRRKKDVLTQMQDRANFVLEAAIANYSAPRTELSCVHLIIARTRKRPIGLPRHWYFSQWDRLFFRGVSRSEVEGDHLSLVAPEKASDTSEAINQYLSENKTG